MNRTIALFVGLAVLLAHTLTIHDTLYDDFAPPYELAHVAYRISRNLVYGDGLSWAPGHAGFDAYPSPLWIAITAFSQRVYLGANIFSQTVGILSALATAITLSRFRPERAAGLIAPLLLVVSGAQAAAAASGTENALFASVAIFCFLALESGWRKRFAVALVVLCATRPEAVVFAFGFGVLALLRDRKTSLAKRALPFVPAFIWLGAIALLRYSSNGHWLSPTGLDVFAFDSGRAGRGLAFVIDFARSQATPLLVVVPIAMLLVGKLTPFATRCLFIATLWTLIVIARGGLSLPFAQVMLPALPFAFLATQTAMFVALDRVGLVRKIALTALALAIAISGIASRSPSDLGPIPLNSVYKGWFGDGYPAQYQSGGHIGRTGLAKEIRDTSNLRNVALFMRDHLEGSDSVLTPWPGSAGYLSRLNIIDLLGRTHLWPGQERLAPWLGIPKVDLVVALQSEPNYIVFANRPQADEPSIQSLSKQWTRVFDSHASEPGRDEQITSLFEGYEVISVPVKGLERPGAARPSYYFLLRKLALARRPQVEIAIDGDKFAVEVRHASHEQICDLRLALVDDAGATWSIDPRGIAHKGSNPVARSGLELYASDRPFRLMVGEIPALPAGVQGVKAMRLSAVLTNPGAKRGHEFGRVSNEAVVRLP